MALWPRKGEASKLRESESAKKYLYLPVFHVVQRRWLEEVEQRLGGG